MARKTKGQEDAATEDAATEDAATEDAATEGAATEDAATEDAATEELHMIREALTHGDYDRLYKIRDNEDTKPSLKIAIATLLALAHALGTEAGATKQAYDNLWNYAPPVEKTKKEKIVAFNEVKALSYP